MEDNKSDFEGYIGNSVDNGSDIRNNIQKQINLSTIIFLYK